MRVNLIVQSCHPPTGDGSIVQPTHPPLQTAATRSPKKPLHEHQQPPFRNLDTTRRLAAQMSHGEQTAARDADRERLAELQRDVW